MSHGTCKSRMDAGGVEALSPQLFRDGMRGPHFLFIRHGEADDVNGRCIGHTDVPLSSAGGDAMRALVDRWPAELDGIRPVRLVSSDLRRAVESAAILRDAWSLGVAYDPRLREMSFGEWDGRSWQDLELRDGERLGVWMQAWTTAVTPGGEGAGDVARRAAVWLGTQLTDGLGESEWVTVVSHAGWIRAALCLLLGRPLGEMFSIPVEHARVTAVRWTESGYETLVANAGPAPTPGAG